MKYVQSKTKVKESVTSNNKPDGTTAVDDLEIAPVLNNFFGMLILYTFSCHSDPQDHYPIKTIELTLFTDAIQIMVNPAKLWK